MTALAALRYLVAELEYHRDHPACRFEPETLIVASGAREAVAEADDDDDDDLTDLESQLEAAFHRR